MFDNPEKLMILLVIALLILGPSRLAGFGGSLGRAMRDFRNAVRGAQDEARSAFSEFTEEASSTMHEVQHALPAPDAMADTAWAGSSIEPEPAAADSTATPATPHPGTSWEDDPSSLASEPTAAALREVARQAQHSG